MRGYQSLYICGTDEYGTATEMKALTGFLSEKFYKNLRIFKRASRRKKFVINITDCTRKSMNGLASILTSLGEQRRNIRQSKMKKLINIMILVRIAQSIFLKIHQNGYTSVDKQKQLHCGSCEK